MTFDKVVQPSQAGLDVLFERWRQIDAEGWTVEHDDRHNDEELARAAACYAMPMHRIADNGRQFLNTYWPSSWARVWWKPTNRRRDLVKAAALIIAEIERLDRAAAAAGSKPGPTTTTAHATVGPALQLFEIEDAYKRVRLKHAPMRGPHEGYAVLLEEVDELWDEVKKWQPPKADKGRLDTAYVEQMSRLRKEALHVAAMALAFLVEVCDAD